ncbi:WD40-repeat-containing domain protein [Chytridium lagenaria]|nr:WD40-repeat-containing domain protein [Chytridium lagenaria]
MSSAYPLIFRPPALGRPLPIPAALTAREILPGSPRIKRANGGKYLAIADEEGTVGLLILCWKINENDERISWRAHQNAIFDICWSPMIGIWYFTIYRKYSPDAFCTKKVTASGDQTCKLWDVENTHMICLFAGHDCSVKSVTFDPMAPNVFATAARDGNIMIWDPSKSKAKKSLLVTQSYGVTAVRYLTLSPDILASSGAADGLVKFWDMRQHGAHWKKNAPQPVEKSALPEYATRPHGLSSLTLCPTGTRLFASCMDHSVHQYSTRNLGVPDAVFSSANLRICSFYVRTTVSPDGGFVACGSTDSGLHVWEVERPELPPLVMGAHQGEVTALSWSKTDFDELASCSDDLTVRVWKYRPQFDEEVEEDVAVRHLRGRTVEV